MIEATIKVQIFEFDDFLEDTVNEMVLNHAVSIWKELDSFLIDAGQVLMINTNNVTRSMRV